jgi:hypothetical protein
VGWWWGLRITSGIASRVVGNAGADNSIEGLLSISWTAIGMTLVIDMPLLICQLLMILRTQRNQEARYSRIQKSQSAPPSPDATDNPFAKFVDPDR